MKTVLKRTLSILLCAVLVFGAAPLQGLAELDWHLPKLPSLVSLFVTKAEAADATSGSCGTGATWNYDTETQTLTISGTGGISNYSSYQGLTYAPWRSYSDSMKTLVIKNGITSIGSYAFSGCTGLTSVTIPDSVTSIGFMAFYCTGLTRVNIDNFNAWCRISFGNDGANPLSCAHHLYMNGSEVTNAVIPTDLVAIGAYQFNGWSALETVTIPDSVTRIDSDAFSGCTGLTSITIPNSVISIGYYAFEHCSGLTSITIPDSVTSIGDLAFRGCSRLTNITIPDSVTTIGNQAFSDCSKLASIRLSSNLTAISSYAFSSCLSLSSVTIPDSVTSIGSYAFNGCSALTTVVIPDSVTIIGEKAFYQCSALKSVNIPDGVTKLDDYAFAECQTLPSISLPGSISVMGNYVFQNCKNLASITFEEEFYEIPSCTCYGCTGLKNIVFADSVKTVGSSAFYGCIGLKSLALGNGVETVGSQAFYGCSGIRSLTVPSSVATIGSQAFYNCTGLTDVALHQGLKTIDNDAFHGCVGLKAITVPAGVTTIGGGAFRDCTGLRAITLPDTLTLIGQDAFYNTAYYNNNSNWTQNVLYIGNHLVGASGISGDYEIKAGVKCIANGAFNGCSYLTGTVIPSGVTAIPYSAFYGCSRLTSVTIPDSVTSIGVDAFYGCTGLKSVTIPDSVTSIGSYAFQNCTGLTSVTIPDSVTSIGSCAFQNCTGLTSVRLPSGLKKISSNLFNYSGLKTVKIPSSVTLIEYAAFNCSLTTVYYTGSESEWNRISISDYNTSLNNATKYFESVLEDDTQQTGTVTYYADGSHTCTLNLNLEAQWFAQENTIYNHELARFCAGFAMLGYMKGHTDKLRDALSAMGFDGDRADINLNTGRDEVNYFIADQQIIVNGRKTRLVFAGLIGSNGDQWYSNFDPDATESSMYHKDAEKGDNHLGFIDARDYVYYQLSKYYEDNNIDKGSAKLLLTGHSRGAAAANLLAAELIDNGRFANANSIYTYTFATPRGTALEKAESIRYNSIFNIVNPEDFVTKVMLDSWGFKRYGTTYTLPSKTNDNQYSKYLTNMRPNFYKYTGKTYTPYTLGEATTYAAVKETGLIIRDVNMFYQAKIPVSVQNGSLVTPFTFFKRTLCPLVKNLSHMGNSEFLSGAAYSISLLADPLAVFFKTLLLYFLDFNLNADTVELSSGFACAHQMETYCAYMMSLTAAELTKTRKGLLNSVNCPVDVEVYDNATGNLVGRIVNNEVDETILARENSVAMIVDGDSKQFWLPDNGDYRVVLTGNDAGTMDYTVAEIDPDLGEVNRVNFFDVPVAKDVEMVGELPEDLVLEEYELQMPDETTLPPTEQIEKPETAQFTVTAAADGDGVVTESVTATSGDYVTLTAVPNAGASFAGWFEGETPVCETPDYGFVVKENRQLVAKFEPLPTYSVKWMADDKELDSGAYYEGAPITQPEDPSMPGYTFTGWTPAVPETMPAQDLTFTAVFEPKTYTATLIADGATVAEIPFTYGQKSITLPDVPKKEGYTGAWPTYTLGAENLTITAIYTLNTYKATYYVDEMVLSAMDATFGAAVPVPRSPEKAGYTFTGWTPEIPEAMPAEDLTFYAVFEPITYYATFIADGKQVGEKISFTVEDDSIIPPDVPAKAGFTGAWESYTIGAKDITIAAIYTPIPSTIKIQNYTATKSVDYKTTITFTAIVTDAPKGATIQWFVNDKKAEKGETCTVNQATADYTVQCKLIGSDGSVLAESEVETVKVNTGFFAKLVAFFKGLFGNLPVITQAIKDTL